MSKRILFLADVNSAHTQRWATALSSEGFSLAIFTLSKPDSDWYSKNGIIIYETNLSGNKIFSASDLLKISYVKNISSLKKVIKEFKPDVVHAHYASSYGLLGRLSRFHPFFISVWGSDILDFPKRSLIHKYILNRNLISADKIFATSKMLQDEIFSLCKIKPEVVPFGIDTTIFSPSKNQSDNRNDIVIGTIKSLEHIYGIEELMRAFALLKSRFQDLKLKLMLVGDGSAKRYFNSLADSLNITEVTSFAGYISHDKIPDYHNAIDIFVNASHYESFGVAVLEASASGRPVIASNTGGLKEVVIDNVSGFLTKLKDVNDIAEKLETLIRNPHLRNQMGEDGRKFVIENYEWKSCVKRMGECYLS